MTANRQCICATHAVINPRWTRRLRSDHSFTTHAYEQALWTKSAADQLVAQENQAAEYEEGYPGWQTLQVQSCTCRLPPCDCLTAVCISISRALKNCDPQAKEGEEGHPFADLFAVYTAADMHQAQSRNNASALMGETDWRAMLIAHHSANCPNAPHDKCRVYAAYSPTRNLYATLGRRDNPRLLTQTEAHRYIVNAAIQAARARQTKPQASAPPDDYTIVKLKPCASAHPQPKCA